MNNIPSLWDSVPTVPWTENYRPGTILRNLGAFWLPGNLTREINSTRYPGGGTPYGLAALRSEEKGVFHSREGSRNTTLWRAGCAIGALIGGGELEAKAASAVLVGAAQATGLCQEEIHQVLFRPDGALATGIRTPRNSNGDLADQYLAVLLSPNAVDENLAYWGSVLPWLEQLNDDARGWEMLALQARFQGLGVLYWSTYLYFLHLIHDAMISEAKGTLPVFLELSAQFWKQADEWERVLLEGYAGVQMLLANRPIAGLMEPDLIIDYEQLAGGGA